MCRVGAEQSLDGRDDGRSGPVGFADQLIADRAAAINNEAYRQHADFPPFRRRAVPVHEDGQVDEFGLAESRDLFL